MSLDQSYGSCFTIAIDPGHGIWVPNKKSKKAKGAIDPGAVSKLPISDPNHQYNIVRENHKEHNYALQISRYLKSYLMTELGSKASTFLTRDKPIGAQESKQLKIKDKKSALQLRAVIANNANAEILISIHLNDYSDPKSNGFEVIYKPGEKNSTESKRLADSIIHSNKQVGMFRDRGTKKGNLSVLRNFKGRAGVLVECGFMSYRGGKKADPHPALVKIVTTPKAVANMIGKGVVNYIRQSDMMRACKNPF